MFSSVTKLIKESSSVATSAAASVANSGITIQSINDAGQMLIQQSSSVATSAAVSVANSGITIQSINNAVHSTLQTYAPTGVYCSNSSCKKCISKTTLYGTVTSNNTCRICGKLFCSKCLVKTTFPVPNNLLNIQFQAARKTGSNEKEASNETADYKQMVCCGSEFSCLLSVVNACMALLREETEGICGSNLASYLLNNEDQVTCPFPCAELNDTYQMKAMRYSFVAAIVADISGLSAAYQAVKFLYMSSVGFNILMKADMFSVAGPMLEALKVYGITGPSALLRLYYLSCKHALQYKMDTANYRRAVLLQGGGSGVDSTVLSATCPTELLDYVNKFVTPAQWLYIATLPAPYDDSKWNSWYLSRVIQRQGWTLLMCVNETTRLPNDQKCPAFAVVVRHRKEHGREAMVVIRGSKSTMDWAINFDEAVEDFQYYLSPTNYVQGQVHRGIHQGALGILDGYNLRPYILDLVGKGYDLTIVGHSLGAGTATLVAAELRNSIHQAKTMVANQKLLKAVVFSSPPVVTETLADAFMQSELVVNVVYGNDIVPNISRRNMAILAKEIIEFGNSPQAAEWTKGDQSDLYQYITNMGKAAEMKRHNQQQQQLKDNEGLQDGAVAAVVGIENNVGSPPEGGDVGSSEPESALTTAAVSTVSTEMEKKQMELEALQASAIILYSPGPIVHIFKEITGAYDAIVLSHKHKTFARMELLLEHAVEDHKMKNYRNVISAIRFVQRQRQTSLAASSDGASSSWLSGKKTSPTIRDSKVSEEIKTRQSIAMDSVNAAEGYFSPTKANASGLEATSWRPCSVCELDVAWPYMMHSDANRSTVTHNCSMCGGVVCSICAPAGDKIPGDGINQTIELKDLRIANPSLGIFDPQRVCIPCYFEEVLK